MFDLFYPLISFILFSLGLSSLWSLSDIFSKPRFLVAKYFPVFLRKMLLCMECSGFWIGGASSVFFHRFLPGALIFPESTILPIIFGFFFGGVINYLIIKIVNRFELLGVKN